MFISLYDFFYKKNFFDGWGIFFPLWSSRTSIYKNKNEHEMRVACFNLFSNFLPTQIKSNVIIFFFMSLSNKALG